jgi:hypothetical protein
MPGEQRAGYRSEVTTMDIHEHEAQAINSELEPQIRVPSHSTWAEPGVLSSLAFPQFLGSPFQPCPLWIGTL